MNMLFKSRKRSSASTEMRFECETLESRVMLSSVQLIASGVEGTELMQLQINGVAVETWNLGTGAYEGIYQTYNYETPDAAPVTIDQVRVEFLNDFYDPENGVDANVRLDAVVIDGVRYETEAANVLSTGTWFPVTGVEPGFYQNEFLHTNGYFQFASDSTPVDADPLTPGSVIINEIHYNPGPSEDGDAEFIELFNTTDTAIDLSGASFVGFNLVFQDGTTIEAGQYAIIGPSIALAESTWGVTPIAEFASGGISGGGELIQLVAADGTTIIDEVDYLDQAPWSPQPDGNGPSLELRDPGLDNSLATNWGASLGAPTPGAENSIFGTEATPPITDIVVTSGEVLPNQAIEISATIEDATTATLIYKIGFDGPEQSVAMTDVGDTWSATVPGQEAGELIRYRIESDVAVAPFNESINYFGLVVSPTNIVDNTLPVFKFWVDEAAFEELVTTDLVFTDTQLPVVVALGNQVVDNARLKIRGGDFSRANYAKKSLKFELPSGQGFDVGDEGSYIIDEFGVQADFGDWAQVTPDISWDVFNAETDSFTTSFFMHVQLNNQFHGIFRFQELYDGAWRDANGFNGDDELYKAGGGAFGETVNFDKKRPDDDNFTSIERLNEVLLSEPTAAKTSYLYRNVNIANVTNHMAISALMRHHDQNSQNFYMLLDADTQTWSIVEWDVDRTWVINEDEVTDFTTTEVIRNELFDAVWEVPEFQEMYWRRMQTLVDTYLSDDQLIDRHEELLEQIGATNSALEFAKWGRNDIYSNRFWQVEFNEAIEERRTAFANETRMPGTASGNYDVVINELHYNPLDGDAEFIELYNNSDESVDLSGWQVDGIGLTIGYGTVLLPGESIVFSDDLVQFKTQYAGDISLGGQYSGGLSGGGEPITLLDASGNVVDFVEYDDRGDWPTEPDGDGFTLALLDPSLDNSLASSWVASAQINGTPGLSNDTVIETSTIEIFAAGETGNEAISLEIAGEVVATYQLSEFGGQAGDLQSQNFLSLNYVSPQLVDISDVRINFTNDFYDPDNGIDYNLAIDRIVINEVSYETEAPDVFSTGSWLPEDGIVPGFRGTEVIHSEGYFQYGVEEAENQPPIVFADTDTIVEALSF